MFKRLFWVFVGVGITLYIGKKLDAFAHKFTPQSLGKSAGKRIQSFGSALKEFWKNYRAAKAERELKLREMYLNNR